MVLQISLVVSIFAISRILPGNGAGNGVRLARVIDISYSMIVRKPRTILLAMCL